MARRFDVTKGDIMRRDDAAVQLALGESQIVAETREYLLDKGVKLDLFKKEAPRSDKIILVKNLPSGALPSELRVKFERFGGLGRVVMPPSGVSALVEFSGSINAKKAFKGVTHSRLGPLHSSILYLEWAPLNCLEDEKTQEKRIKSELSSVAATSGASGTMLFVKNLNFVTEDAGLRAVFESVGKVAECSVSKRLEKGKYISMGYGWVRMSNAEAAQKAIKRLQGSELDGHRILLKISANRNEGENANRKEAEKQEQPSNSAKIMVRNVPFSVLRRRTRLALWHLWRAQVLPNAKEGGNQSAS